MMLNLMKILKKIHDYESKYGIDDLIHTYLKL